MRDAGERGAAAEPQLRPVLVVGGSGRTGSTMVMGMLAAMPEVAFDRRPPYEVLHLTHLARVAATWRAPDPGITPSMLLRARLRRRIERDVLPRIHRERAHVNTTGPVGGGAVAAPRLRSPHLLDADHQDPPFAHQILQAGWSTMAGALAVAHEHEHDTGALWFAEKPPLWLVDELDGVIDHRVVARVRDPRDTFCSHRAFFRARRRPDHGRRGRERDDLGYLQRFAEQQAAYGRWLAPRRADPTVHVLPYEDAVHEPDRIAAALAGWLGVTLEADRLGASLDRTEQQHGTAGGATASIARWQRDLSEQEQAVAADAFAEALELLGYDV